MGRKRSTQCDPEDEIVGKEGPAIPLFGLANAYWHICVRCGKVLSGPHTTMVEICDAQVAPNVCEGECGGEE